MVWNERKGRWGTGRKSLGAGARELASERGGRRHVDERRTSHESDLVGWTMLRLFDRCFS